MTDSTNQPALIAYHVPDTDKDKKARWTRIGAAWAHNDGKGFNVTLDLIPTTTGRIVLRDYEPKADEDAEV